MSGKKKVPDRKPKSDKGKGSKRGKTAILSFLKNDTVRFVAGVLFGLISVLTLISFVSYLFTWSYDQSLLTEDGFLSNIVTARNSGGKLGFAYSRFMISELFGFGAFVLPFLFAGISVFCFRSDKIRLGRLLFLSSMGAIVLSELFSFVFSFTPAKDIFGDGAGGSYGYYMNEWLMAMTGKAGTALIVLFFLLLWIVLLNNKVVGMITGLFDSMFRKKDQEEAPIDNIETDGDKDSEYGTGGDEDEMVGEGEEDEDDEGSDLEHQEQEVSMENGDSIFEIVDRPVYNKPEPELESNGETEIIEGGSDIGNTGKNEGVAPLEIIDPESPDQVLSDEEWKHRYDPRLSLSTYKMPDLSLLNDYSSQVYDVPREELERNNRLIVSTLRDYKIAVSKISARVGPTVTLYEIVPAPGVRVQQIMRLQDDIARSLAARGVRVVILTGTNAVGIEVANEKPSIVSMKSILDDPKFKAAKYDLPVVIGRTISNEAMSFDLAKMPHLLVAGATGQGKSVGLNAIISSLLYRKHPAELKFVLVDPKKVELSLYAPIEKHYLAKLPDSEDAIITDTKRVVYTLRSLCKLMDKRYDLLKAASVRNVKEYNEKFLQRRLNPYKGHEYMSYIVVIIDEFADLLMTAGREVEEPIARLAQLARAIGIHLVIATQRPTTNIITGTIKANFPARIAFRVISSIDSKTILDQTGANQLIGKGDMLVSTGSSEPVRVQCAFIDTPEVDRITQFIHSQAGFGSAYLLPECEYEDGTPGLTKTAGGDRDDLFKEAARLIVREQIGSTSLIQRKMNLGYNRAGRIMDQLEDAGIVGPSEGSKPRQVRITGLDMLEELLNTL